MSSKSAQACSRLPMVSLVAMRRRGIGVMPGLTAAAAKSDSPWGCCV